MTILTKRQADAAIVESLFKPGGTLVGLPKIRLNLGKYKPGALVGKELPSDIKVRLAWVERRRDSDGPYDALFCISDK